jgi:DNA-binding transcriptional LysR family regulator
MHFRMDWRSVNFDWNRARAFLVTAEEGSLSAAARALGMAQPTLGRQVTALEQELGVALFERVGRGLTLTPSGLELMDHVRAMGEAAARMSLVGLG